MADAGLLSAFRSNTPAFLQKRVRGVEDKDQTRVTMKQVRSLKSAAKVRSSLDHAVRIVDRICSVTGSIDFTNELQVGGSRLRRILNRRDNAKLFDWLVEAFSHQGVSDQLADDYMQRHGRLTWASVSGGVAARVVCPKLNSFWQFEDCRYSKSTGLCAEPQFRPSCELPNAVLRNGRLNQLAYSLFLFIRDVADRDLIGWIDERLRHEAANSDDSITVGRTAIIEPMRNVYGVADKVLMMAFADLLMSAPAKYPGWFEIGAAMIAVDTLVHAFLTRTGVLQRLGHEHPYGPACYQQHGCSDVIRTIAGHLDCRKYNPAFPANFPRFVQHAIWHYCSQSGMDVCNGNRIDDRQRCRNKGCDVYSICSRNSLFKA
jgi:hypothetical protein